MPNAFMLTQPSQRWCFSPAAIAPSPAKLEARCQDVPPTCPRSSNNSQQAISRMEKTSASNSGRHTRFSQVDSLQSGRYLPGIQKITEHVTLQPGKD